MTRAEAQGDLEALTELMRTWPLSRQDPAFRHAKAYRDQVHAVVGRIGAAWSAGNLPALAVELERLGHCRLEPRYMRAVAGARKFLQAAQQQRRAEAAPAAPLHAQSAQQRAVAT